MSTGSNGARSNGGVSAAAKHVVEHASSLARLEVRLALLEVRSKLVKLGLGIGLLVAAAAMALCILLFLVAASAAALALVMPVWAALLTMAGGLLLATGALAGLGVTLLRRGAPPVPAQAIEEARLTKEALRGD